MGTGSASHAAWQTRQGRREVRLSYTIAAVWGHEFEWGDKKRRAAFGGSGVGGECSVLCAVC